MLNENIRSGRKAKGLSQEELAVKLNVVRQTISKWESGLSVPDADLLISLSEALDIPVAALLGESVIEQEPDRLTAICEKLELINLQLAQKKAARRKLLQGLLIALCAVIVLGFVFFAAIGSAYLNWNYGDPETAVVGTGLHVLEWLFVRVAPFVLIAAVAVIIGIRVNKR